MATNIPPKLKSADISRFAMRAAQVEKAKPVIAYWCNYWIVSQILSKKLHTADTESMAYTTDLMDKLEQMKSQNADNDAILDDMAGQAYVEQFGLETFQRADNAVRANKASRQTADTFLAAAAFLDLSHIWGNPEPEVAAKIKYAKFHALRIAKAIKAGEDPNLSNPKREPSPTPEEPLDPNDLEVQLITGTPSPARGRPRTASVEDVPDEHHSLQRSLAAQSIIDQSLHPSRAPSLPRPADLQTTNFMPTPPDVSAGDSYYTQGQPQDASDVSPMESSPERKGSGGGGYFPSGPTFTTEDTQMTNERLQQPPPPPQSYYYPPQQPLHQPSAPQPTPQAPSYQQAPIASDRLICDEQAIAKAQKHARWAISALNFEDVKTAVKELREALETLGAR
ncbi:hypothetical protein FGG08_004354 [Glutinoglossum americanum]|uniref:DUF605-domain-containing protein n=1 Tax=Glutinoglossum americanum TaxID=1670608 RepID=A0A9P8L2L4_9PEZI|nr:hypothetical protein FGG08_004354 [Glutinoglossum americanum]